MWIGLVAATVAIYACAKADSSSGEHASSPAASRVRPHAPKAPPKSKAETWDVANDQPLLFIEDDWNDDLLGASGYICVDRPSDERGYWLCVLANGEVLYWGGFGMAHEGLYRWRIDSPAVSALFELGQRMSWAPAGGPAMCPVSPSLDVQNTRVAMKVGNETSSLIHRRAPSCTPTPVARLEECLRSVIEARPAEEWGLPLRPAFVSEQLEYEALVKKCMRGERRTVERVSLDVTPEGAATLGRTVPDAASAKERRCFEHAADRVQGPRSRLGGTVTLFMYFR